MTETAWKRKNGNNELRAGKVLWHCQGQFGDSVHVPNKPFNLLEGYFKSRLFTLHFINHHLTCWIHFPNTNTIQTELFNPAIMVTQSLFQTVCAHKQPWVTVYLSRWTFFDPCAYFAPSFVWLLAMTHWWIITAEWKCGVLCTALCGQRDSWCKYPHMCSTINGEGKKTVVLSLEIVAYCTLPASGGCPAQPPDLAGSVFSPSARSGRSARPHCFPSPVTAQLLSVNTWLGVNK